MRKMILMCLAGMLFLAPGLHAEEKQPLKTQKDKVSYGIGMDMVKNFKQQGLEVDLDMVIRGMRDKAAGGKLLLSEEESRRILADYNRDVKAKQSKLKQETAAKNRKEGQEFLKANKTKEGVVTTASGLQYKVIKAGSGRKPTEDDSVTVRYRGTLIDGTVFDSTDRIGYPVTINVKDSVITGWSEALKLMPAGSKWQVVVPSELGYGENGVGRDIGPNATLIYEIELIAVNPQPVAKKNKDAAK